MKRKNKNGFTLVELLAVIVILAIILVIAVPKIMDVIKDTTKASLESSAKMVAAQVENQYTVAQTLGKEFGDTGSCMQEWAGLNDVDYASCTYEVTTDGTAKVTIKGQGKFKGLYACNATRSSATATEEECAANILVTHIQELYANETTRTSNGLTKDNTVDQNIRYAGANNAVKNYVEFGNTNELWRIIGIFEMTTSDGRTEELVKIVREDSIGNMTWDSSASDVNNGVGINEWSQADLKNMLNTYYIGDSTSCTYCNNQGQATCTNSCNSTVTPINSTYRNMIESVVWNTGALDWEDPLIYDPDTEILNPVNWYNAERGNKTGKICMQGKTLCNDTVERTITWEGLVALPYITDWSYASSETGCRNNLEDGIDWDNDDFTNASCKKNNWMHYGTTGGMAEFTWMLSPVAYSDFANAAFFVCGDGTIFFEGGNPFRVRPTVYLKSNVQIIDGDGSSGNTYKLSA